MRWPIRIAPQWNPWFAWYPVRIGNERVWWEWVERAIFGGGAGDSVAVHRLPAQVGTHPKGGDAKQAPGDSLSDAVAEGHAPPLSNSMTDTPNDHR